MHPNENFLDTASEKYYKVIKKSKEVVSTEESLQKPSESAPQILGKSIAIIETNPVQSPLSQCAAGEIEDSSPIEKTLFVSNYADIMTEYRIKALEEYMNTLPTYPSYSISNCHIHCEHCGHPMIIHNNHIDFIQDGELHYADENGMVYPHKLEISKINPNKCTFSDTNKSYPEIENYNIQPLIDDNNVN